MKIYYVYIVKCSDNSYYTGFTNDLERRINEHNDGLNSESYTYTRKPVELVFNHEFNDVNQAIRFEKQVKGWSRKKKEAIINDNWDLLPLLSKNRMKD
ncbi:GIY-YIG nuclease family protein [Chryseobacterium sp. PCH239]|uniref:GIY-YIG nuclease family protein n=1 Tax=Chryseobacterium sp. PCH239 TaxID=2825845 RepID=UPI001C108FC3|nr:GIY-YIG nuclease family protein [Chryseobacterium sp. PCH239]QWT84919.1 GIY-YIG nuclease family protein [Chryseobacterium sp. PCH239]